MSERKDIQLNEVKTGLKLLSIAEVAKMLGVRKETLRKWDKSGYLKAVRIGPRKARRYYIQDVLKIIDKNGL